MHCTRCGAQLGPGMAFCSACGASVGVMSGVVSPVKRPGLITLLAVLQFIGAAITLVAGVVTLIAAAGADRASSEPLAAIVGIVLAGVGALQLTCGIGLWKLKNYGRTLQLVFAWIGLIGIPIGTVISILILVYMLKPGVKLLFSGRPASEMSGGELTQIAAVTEGSGAMVVLVVILVAVVSIAMVGIIAAIAIPGLLRARMAGNEASAIGSLRSITSGQLSYAAACGGGGYAVSLDDLVKPSKDNNVGFVGAEMGRNGVMKSGYRFTVMRDAAPEVTDMGTAADTCNRSTGTPASSFVATAEPVQPGNTGSRYFAVDARGVVFFSDSPITNPIADSPGAIPIR
jgi:type IV pilus assembly protein PilA